MEAFNFINSEEQRNPFLGLASGYDSLNRFDDTFLGQREVSKVPFKVLDAPSLSDDFYLNLVDWSDQNFLAVGLGH